MEKNSDFFVVCCFFSKSTYLKDSFRNTIRVSNSLDPDQAQHFVGPDLGPNCLQRLSADNTSRQRVKDLEAKGKTVIPSCCALPVVQIPCQTSGQLHPEQHMYSAAGLLHDL